MSIAEVHAAQHHLAMMAVALILMVSVIGGGIVFLAVSRWTRRLINLVQATERIAQGDYTAAQAGGPPDNRRDEQLATAVLRQHAAGGPAADR